MKRDDQLLFVNHYSSKYPLKNFHFKPIFVYFFFKASVQLVSNETSMEIYVLKCMLVILSYYTE